MKKILIMLISMSVGLLSAQETIKCYVQNGNDDAYQLYCDYMGQPPTGEMFIDQIGLYMGYTADPSRFYLIGVRYASVPVPKDAIIESAYIQFTSLEDNPDQHDVIVCAQGDLNPGPFTTEDYNISDRIAFPSYTTWSIAEWQAFIPGPNQRTHNIGNIVQHLVNRDGWVKGNAMVFLFDGTTPHFGEVYPKAACAWEYGGDFYAPVLEITYYPPASVDEASLYSTFKVYPMPAEDQFTVSFEDLKEGEYTLTIFDSQGKKIKEIFNGFHSSGDLKILISVDGVGLETGIYVVSIQGKKGYSAQKLIVR